MRQRIFTSSTAKSASEILQISTSYTYGLADEASVREPLTVTFVFPAEGCSKVIFMQLPSFQQLCPWHPSFDLLMTGCHTIRRGGRHRPQRHPCPFRDCSVVLFHIAALFQCSHLLRSSCIFTSSIICFKESSPTFGPVPARTLSCESRVSRIDTATGSMKTVQHLPESGFPLPRPAE